MTHNKKIILGSIAAVAILTAVFVSCQPGKPMAQNPAMTSVKKDSVVSPVLSVPGVANAIPCIKTEEVVQANHVSIAPVPIGEGRVEKENLIIAVPAAEKKVSLHRIDFSGIYALPENVQANQVKQVFLDAKPAQYMITENGNLDIIESQLKSAVTAVLK